MKADSTQNSLETLLESYDFTLPNSLIATHPLENKESCKLLVYKYKEKKLIHTHFSELFSFIPRKYLVVLNDSKVIKARLFCEKIRLDSMHSKTPSMQAKKEIFYHKPLCESSGTHLAQIKGRVKIGDIFKVDSNNFIKVLKVRSDGFREIQFIESKILNSNEVFTLLEKCGQIPLPPYIKRPSTARDEIDYQSIFATNNGSIAAPTASLHFSHKMLKTLESNYDIAKVTLHVGAGTFKPVESSDIRSHKMHAETCQISQNSANKILNATQILCVGSTAMRSVEWLMRENLNENLRENIVGENDIFLHPLNRPQKVNALLTNFHLPKSSLIMLVSSLIGRKETLNLYNEAIKNKYRFYSYGDCMLLI